MGGIVVMMIVSVSAVVMSVSRVVVVVSVS